MAEKLDVKAAFWAGIVAGTIFVVLEMLLVAFVAGDSPWAPPRMMAGIALGADVLPPPASFDAPIVAAGMAVHFALSLVYGLLFGWAIAATRARLPLAVLAGIMFGLILYAVNFYLFTDLFPWFAMARNWMTILAHAVFGAALSATYRLVASRRPVSESARAVAR